MWICGDCVEVIGRKKLYITQNFHVQLHRISTLVLIVAEEEYECAGFRGEAIFPGGLLKENDEVKIYYGAADTVECLASAKIEDLINFCYNKL